MEPGHLEKEAKCLDGRVITTMNRSACCVHVIISWTLGEINWGEDRDGEVGSLGVRIEL